MTRLRITYGPWGETLGELRDAAAAAEDAGAKVLWVPELHRSATIAAAAIAEATDTAHIGTGIALAFARSPTTTALEALDLDELTDGRFILGLGSGVRRLNEDWHGVDFEHPVRRLAETVACIRAFTEQCTTGEPIHAGGDLARLRIRGYQRPFPVRRPRIPVYLAGVGPAMTRCAARVGDGWISHELCSPAYLKDRLLPRVDEGLRQSGRERADFDVVVSACCSIDRDRDTARGRAAGLVGFYASVRTYADLFDFHGLGAEQAAVVDRFRAGAGADGLAGAVPARMTDALTLTGPLAEVRDRVLAYEGLADTVKLTPPTHGLSAPEIRAAQERVIALIAELSRECS
ncbi:LLM class flavin-dependent oxidoreductase [Streptodolium elevatio]|uniref:LLM class flavin-dependent oxidoreductase n=1 Tax=Streptodolium elevatio TaxID=3157996 RepID=A0ABV3D8E7_9ACTN